MTPEKIWMPAAGRYNLVVETQAWQSITRDHPSVPAARRAAETIMAHPSTVVAWWVYDHEGTTVLRWPDAEKPVADVTLTLSPDQMRLLLERFETEMMGDESRHNPTLMAIHEAVSQAIALTPLPPIHTVRMFEGTMGTRVRHLRPGDMIDLENDIHADPHGTRLEFHTEYGVVVSVAEETPECWLVGIEGVDSFGFPPDHLVAVHGHDTAYDGED